MELSRSQLALMTHLLVSCRPHASTEVPIRVAAASDLSGAFEELGRQFRAQYHQELRFTFGSSGLLARQVEQGAPFDLFAAANASFIDRAVAAGSCDANTKRPYARGRIALWSRRDVTPAPNSLEALRDRRFAHIAIANPEHAPYGQAAREALQQLGLWEELSPRIVYAENVRQALQFAQSRNAEAAIVALALVVNDHENTWHLIDEQQHRPLEQTLVVCHRGSNREGGAAFARFVASEAGQSVLRRYGFQHRGTP